MAVLPLPAGELAPFDALATGIAVADSASRVAYANPAFIELAGLTGWRGYPLAHLSVELHDAIERARTQTSTFTLRGFELATRDPPLRVDVAIGAWRDGGVLLELHVPAQPSSASPRISQSLRGLAHEVKNPLAGLRGAAQLLRRRAAEPDQQRLADLIIAEADRLAALTDRLLRPGGKPHLSSVNAHEVAEHARALIAAEATPELKLERDYDPSLPNFRGDADRLLQLLLNLLRNAMQASARSIVVRTRAEHGSVLNGQPVRVALRLDVIDDGTGVPEALRDALFLPLVSGRIDGTGLGLALAQEIAHEHGGQLDFTSRPGRTVFSLTLPLELAHA
jgi:two-component system nitrogen regulation sensor histidine kinase GlnL